MAEHLLLERELGSGMKMYVMCTLLLQLYQCWIFFLAFEV